MILGWITFFFGFAIGVLTVVALILILMARLLFDDLMGGEY